MILDSVKNRVLCTYLVLTGDLVPLGPCAYIKYYQTYIIFVNYYYVSRKIHGTGKGNRLNFLKQKREKNVYFLPDNIHQTNIYLCIKYHYYITLTYKVRCLFLLEIT